MFLYLFDKVFVHKIFNCNLFLEYGDDVCPYATFQLPENPPTRPLLTKGGFHTGDTLYNVGNVYSGPYHESQNHFMTNMATLPIRVKTFIFKYSYL